MSSAAPWTRANTLGPVPASRLDAATRGARAVGEEAQEGLGKCRRCDDDVEAVGLEGEIVDCRFHRKLLPRSRRRAARLPGRTPCSTTCRLRRLTQRAHGSSAQRRTTAQASTRSVSSVERAEERDGAQCSPKATRSRRARRSSSDSTSASAGSDGDRHEHRLRSREWRSVWPMAERPLLPDCIRGRGFSERRVGFPGSGTRAAPGNPR